MSREIRAFSKRARERRRVAAHLDRAEKLAREGARPRDPVRALVRSLLLDALGEYRSAGRFPRHRERSRRTPVFVDARGTPCAVAHLLALSGHGALVEKIASERNFAFVHALADEPALARWLEDAGLSLDEAALIQPGYAPTCSSAADCVCAPFRDPRRSDGLEDAGALRTTAVLDCTLIATDVARIDHIYGATERHAVGDTLRLEQPFFDPVRRVLVPVLANGQQPLTYGAPGPDASLAYLAMPVSPDGTATCTALDRGAVQTYTQATTAISAMISDDCPRTVARLDPHSGARRCDQGCAVYAPGDPSARGAPATLSLLLSLVSALVFRCVQRRARVEQRARPGDASTSASRL